MYQRGKDLPLICFMITSLSYGGAETVLIKLAVALKKRGWPIKLVSMLVPEVRVEQLTTQGIEVASLDMHRGVPDPRALFKLAALFRTWQPLILHSHMVHANLLGRLVRLLTKVPVQISTAHNIDEGGRWREIAYRITDPLADITTNVSKAAVARYIRVGATPKKRIRFIPNGLDIDEFCPNQKFRKKLREELNIDKYFVWLAIGRLVDAKDYPNMLEAFRRLEKETNTILLIVGQGSLHDELINLAEEMNLSDRVRFLGVRQDIPELMNMADAYVMSSAWEGLPMVLLEAAASGLPIVATDVGGNGEVVKSDVSGYLVSAGDSSVLQSAMQRIMAKTNEKRTNMGRIGREHVENNYAHAHIVKTWEDLYWDLLNQKLG